MARTSALIAPGQPVLHRVSWSNETLPNAPKHYETHTNLSLGTNGVGWGCIHCEKFQNDFMAQTCALIAPVQPICTKFRVVMKHCQMHPNTTRRTKEFMVQWGGSGAFVAKNSDAISWHELVHELHQFNPFCTEFCVVTKYCQIHTNTMRRTQHTSLGSNGVDWVPSLRKILMRLHGTNFCINCTSSTRFAPSFV